MFPFEATNESPTFTAAKEARLTTHNKSKVNNNIDVFCHSKEDNYMMQLLADITKKAILKKYISYDDLYQKKESELFNIFENSYDEEILEFLDKFRNINLNDIPTIKLPKTKIRKINPLVNEVRLN